jgi:hypothetical protein
MQGALDFKDLRIPIPLGSLSVGAKVEPRLGSGSVVLVLLLLLLVLLLLVVLLLVLLLTLLVVVKGAGIRAKPGVSMLTRSSRLEPGITELDESSTNRGMLNSLLSVLVKPELVDRLNAMKTKPQKIGEPRACECCRAPASPACQSLRNERSHLASTARPRARRPRLPRQSARRHDPRSPGGACGAVCRLPGARRGHGLRVRVRV